MMKTIGFVLKMHSKKCDRIFQHVWGRLKLSSRQQEALVFLGVDNLEKLMALDYKFVGRLPKVYYTQFWFPKQQFHELKTSILKSINKALEDMQILSGFTLTAIDETRLMNFIFFCLSEGTRTFLELMKVATPSQFLAFKKDFPGNWQNLNSKSRNEISDLQENVREILKCNDKVFSHTVRTRSGSRHIFGLTLPENKNSLSPNNERLEDTSNNNEEDSKENDLCENKHSLPFPNHEFSSLYYSDEEIDLLRIALSLEKNQSNKILEVVMAKTEPPLRHEVFKHGIDSLAKLIAVNVVSAKRLRPDDLRKDIDKIVRKAFDELREYYNQLENVLVADEPKILEDQLMTFIEWSLSTRSLNVIRNLCLESVDEFRCLEPKKLLKIRNLGKTAVGEIVHLQHLIGYLLLESNPLVKSASISDVSQPTQGLMRNEKWHDFSKIEIANPDDDKSLFALLRSCLTVRSRNVLDLQSISSTKNFLSADEKVIKSWNRVGRKSLHEIMEMQHHVAELIQAGYPNFDSDRLSSGNPLVANTCFNLMEPFQSLMDWIERVVEEMKNPADAKWVFCARYGLLGFPPLTLDEIGNKLGCTKESARQKLNKIEKRALHSSYRSEMVILIDEIEKMINASGGVLTVEEITCHLFAKGSNCEMLSHGSQFIMWLSTFQEWDQRDLKIDSDKVALSSASKILMNKLTGMVLEFCTQEAEEFVDSENWSVSLKSLLNRTSQWCGDNSHLGEQSIQFSKKYLDEALKKLSYHVRLEDDRVYSINLWKKCFSPSGLNQVAEKVFLESGHSMHFSEAVKNLKSTPGVNEKWCLSRETVYNALLTDDKLLLWDRGAFIHKDFVPIPHVLLNKIEKWVIARLGNNSVPFISAFGAYAEFKEDCKKEGIPNEIALHSLLKAVAHPLLVYPRVPYISLNSGSRVPVSVPQTIEEFVLNERGPVALDSLINFALNKLFVKKYQLDQSLARSENIIRLASDSYIHASNWKIDRKILPQIADYVRKVLEQKGHVSVAKIFSEKRVSCKASGISSPRGLYYLLEAHSQNIFDLPKYPVIRRKSNLGRVDSNLKDEIAAWVRTKEVPVSLSEINNVFVKDRGYKPSIVQSHLYNNPDIVRCMTGCFMHKETLGWDEQKQHSFEDLAMSCYRKVSRAGYITGRISSLLELESQLPGLNSWVYWTPAMVSEFLKSRNKFVLLGNTTEAYMPIPNEHGIINFTDLVIYILDKTFGGATSLIELTESLKSDGFIKKVFPKSMIVESSNLVFSEKEVWIDSGRDYA